jgi:hypothetical protein
MSNRDLLTKLLISGVSYSLCPTLPTDNKNPQKLGYMRVSGDFLTIYCCLLQHLWRRKGLRSKGKNRL